MAFWAKRSSPFFQKEKGYLAFIFVITKNTIRCAQENPLWYTAIRFLSCRGFLDGSSGLRYIFIDAGKWHYKDSFDSLVCMTIPWQKKHLFDYTYFKLSKNYNTQVVVKCRSQMLIDYIRTFPMKHSRYCIFKDIVLYSTINTHWWPIGQNGMFCSMYIDIIDKCWLNWKRCQTKSSNLFTCFKPWTFSTCHTCW